MPDNVLASVRFLSISEIVDQWRCERPPGLSKELLETELRRSVLTFRDVPGWRDGDRIPEADMPPLDQLPPVTTQVSRSTLRDFCAKQGWPLPRFWFPDEADPPRSGGRPSNKTATLQEYHARIASGRRWVTKIECARELRDWQAASGKRQDKAETISHWLTGIYPPQAASDAD